MGCGEIRGIVVRHNNETNLISFATKKEERERGKNGRASIWRAENLSAQKNESTQQWGICGGGGEIFLLLCHRGKD